MVAARQAWPAEPVLPRPAPPESPRAECPLWQAWLPALEGMLPRLQRQWTATNSAAEGLDAELSSSLRALIVEAIAALEEHPFRERIERLQERSRS